MVWYGCPLFFFFFCHDPWIWVGFSLFFFLEFYREEETKGVFLIKWRDGFVRGEGIILVTT